ncbi:MAG: ATP-dependent DNA helicase RecQ [Acidobacteria bacterium]|nr:ATP-dependent DNA helicase RecQ [Acidobacteriota bacterium]
MWESPAASAPALAAIISTANLAELLHARFGFAEFRPNQEAVCRALVDGHDGLLVMPTGSGKSLCYQLPGIARGGTTLVISPLIALMEDQAAKLSALGFHAACIHSGRDRAYSRQACLDYCNGALHFLFIAPERLRVAGFPEMLARHKPSLIAIDEAHCISQWGHDFRPDYRMLGQYLPALRPAPVIALTATATPQVQDDIATQLALDHAHRFIHGFRRANIAIEVVETTPSQRAALAHDLLLDDSRRPGIVYVPTRKQAESLAAELAESFSARAYHAGLDADHRRRVQEEFQSGAIEVMVATIAFGMGIDKPDIRTVIHTALPGSIEAYYQEIGRAGRDGLPSRALLMHSYADRYTHDFFLERDYPDVSVLDLIYQRLAAEPIEKAALQKKLRLEADLFDKALEKLWTHGGALVDYAENVALGSPAWRDSYINHGKQKRAQIEQVIRYAEAGQCRMSALVRHFGDHEGSLAPCGICDFCAPTECEAQRFRPPTAAEVTIFERLRAALRNSAPRPTGKLFTELVTGELERDEFENLLAAMAAAGHAQLTESVFEKDGRQIPYRTVHLTFAGKDMDAGAISELVIKDTTRATPTKPSRRRASSKASAPSAPANKARRAKSKADDAIHPDDAPLEEALRAWRLEEARKKRIPAFRIFSDRVLRAIAEERPTNLSDLTAIPGVGLKLAEKFGQHIFRIVGANA